VQSKKYTFEAAETEVKRMINEGELIEVIAPSFKQSLGRIKRLPVSKAERKTFVALDGNVVTCTKRIYTRFIHSKNTINTSEKWFVVLKYDGGSIIYPATDYVQEVGEVNA
jgi:hypothetical protein